MPNKKTAIDKVKKLAIKEDKDIEQLNEKINQYKLELSQKEEKIKYLESLLLAMSKNNALYEEVKKAEDKAKISEQVTDFSIKEIKNRDSMLTSLLAINKEITALSDKKQILQQIIEGFVKAVKGERGVIFIDDPEKGFVPQIFYNMTTEDIFSKKFRFNLARIYESALFKERQVFALEELKYENSTWVTSFLSLPIIFENTMLGVIYADIISSTKTLRLQNVDILELFSSQAAIILNNYSMLDKNKKQNLDIMKLTNLKDQLLGEISKNIKEPLQDIHKIYETYSKRHDERYPEFAEESKKVYTLIEKIKTTVEKFLTIQELEKLVADLYIDEVNFNDLMNEIIQNMQQVIKEKKIDIKYEFTRDFNNYHANQSIMRMIFDELISNAIFYNKVNGKVEIKGYRDGDYLIIDIKDTGIGIPVTELDKIFERFYRTEDSPKMNDKGAGLGLFLVKKFIKYYNGDIEVESDYGHGSTFKVKLLVN